MESLKFSHADARISDTQIQETVETVLPYIADLKRASNDEEYGSPEASVRLPFEESFRTDCDELAAKLNSENLKFVIVIGIGGSNLGTQAIFEATFGTHNEFWMPRILFADTVSPRLISTLRWILADIAKLTNEDEIVINVISKSGTTTETIANFEALYAALEMKFPKLKDRVVCTTNEGSKLWKMADEKGYHKLAIPEKVGGRYSVFSNVGLLPLKLVNLNTQELLDGAQAMALRCLRPEDNPSLTSAVLTHLHAKNNLTINNSFFFNPELESVGKWYRQLMGESIGKEKDADGKVVHAGITPMVSIGSTDLHSMAQLFFGGPRDKFHTLVYSDDPNFDVAVPEKTTLTGLVDGIPGKKHQEIMRAIIGGVKAAFKKNEIPFTEVTFPEVREHYLGQYLQFKMMEMMYLAKLMNLNAFDQPNVEDYKSETRALLP